MFDLLIVVAPREYKSASPELNELRNLARLCREKQIPVRYTQKACPLVDEVFNGCDYLWSEGFDTGAANILITGGLLCYASPFHCLPETKEAGIEPGAVVNFNWSCRSDGVVKISDNESEYAFLSGCIGALAAELYTNLNEPGSKIFIDPKSAVKPPTDEFDLLKVYEVVGVFGKEKGSYSCMGGLPLARKIPRKLVIE